MITVAMINLKGGVGKTSCVHHLAGAVAASGLRVLGLDNDPQASLTQGYWGSRGARGIDPSETIAAIYAGDEPFPDQVIKATGVEGIDLVSGSKATKQYNVPDYGSADYEHQVCLRAFLESIEPDRYDLALIDCPPNLHLCSWAALGAADYMMVPTQPEEYGAQGLHDVQEAFAEVKASINPGLSLLGYVITKAGKKALHHQVEEVLRSIYGPDVFDSKMPDSIDYCNAIRDRLPAAQHKPKGAAAKAMAAIAAEMWARIESRATLKVHRGEVA